jgi:NAD(P)-dependent dehydrogenase (short-subunit alcohol dehydrogenase family)
MCRLTIGLINCPFQTCLGQYLYLPHLRLSVCFLWFSRLIFALVRGAAGAYKRFQFALLPRPKPGRIRTIGVRFKRSAVMETRVMMVTGGAGDLGRAIAREVFSRPEPWAYVAVDKEPEALAAMKADFASCNGQLQTFEGDILTKGFAQEVVDAAIANYGSLHCLVNAAGYARDARILNLDEDDFDRLLLTHVSGAYRFTRAYMARVFPAAKSARDALKAEQPDLLRNADYLRSQPQRVIVNIGSVNWMRCPVGQAAYAAAKAALVKLSRVIAREGRSALIRSFSVSPGYISGKMTAKSIKPDVQLQIEGDIFAGRFGEPAEVADFIMDLIDNPWANGCDYQIDGGM